MIIRTNLKQLRNISMYNKDYGYKDTNVFTLCQDNPDIIICDNENESTAAYLEYPHISFFGHNFKYPNKSINIPNALLDERLLSSNVFIARKEFEIAYICQTRSCPHIKKLSSLGNLKIMGPTKNINTIFESINEARIVPFYRLAKSCFVTDMESALIALSVSRLCIGTPEVANQCEYVVDINSLNTHSDFLSQCNKIYSHTDLQKYLQSLSHQAFFENLQKEILNETRD